MCFSYVLKTHVTLLDWFVKISYTPANLCPIPKYLHWKQTMRKYINWQFWHQNKKRRDRAITSKLNGVWCTGSSLQLVQFSYIPPLNSIYEHSACNTSCLCAKWRMYFALLGALLFQVLCSLRLNWNENRIYSDQMTASGP